MKTQGTDLYLIDPSNNALLDVGCVTEIAGIDSTLDQIETTCLQDQARKYESGLATPGAASFTINIEASNPTHIRLHQIKVSGQSVKWAVGLSDAPGTPPTVAVDSDGADFTLPDSRSWILFEGFMNSFPFTFGLNAVVQSAIGVQVSGDIAFIPATA